MVNENDPKQRAIDKDKLAIAQGFTSAAEADRFAIYGHFLRGTFGTGIEAIMKLDQAIEAHFIKHPEQRPAD